MSEKNKLLSKDEKKSLFFAPLLQISRQTVFLTKTVYKQIKQVIYPQLQDFSKESEMKEEKKKNDLEWGLDCSGQGECQPNIDHSDDEELHEFWEKAEHKKEQEAVSKKSHDK